MYLQKAKTGGFIKKTFKHNRRNVRISSAAVVNVDIIMYIPGPCETNVTALLMFIACVSAAYCLAVQPTHLLLP